MKSLLTFFVPPSEYRMKINFKDRLLSFWKNPPALQAILIIWKRQGRQGTFEFVRKMSDRVAPYLTVVQLILPFVIVMFTRHETAKCQFRKWSVKIFVFTVSSHCFLVSLRHEQIEHGHINVEMFNQNTRELVLDDQTIEQRMPLHSALFVVIDG